MFSAMEQIILSFDISCKKFGYDEAADLRRDISHLLDKALRDAEVGKWAGGTCGLSTMEIFIRSYNPDEAIPVIESTIDGHWLRPLMEIKRQALDTNPTDQN